MKQRLCIWIMCLAALCLTACGGGAPEAVQTESPDLLDTVRSAVAKDGAEEASPDTDADIPEWDAWTDDDASQSDAWTNDAPQSETWTGGASQSETRTDDAWEDGDIQWTTVSELSASEISEDGAYTTRDEVALYLHLYGHLPGNFITKKQAQSLGWSGGSLESYAPGKCIGGDRFGNYEGLLPANRSYHECDINTLGAKSRGAERIVYSDDGLIYYTADHYNTFTLLYGTP